MVNPARAGKDRLRPGGVIRKCPQNGHKEEGSFMKMSADVFEAFINCATKCWLRAVGEPTSGNVYAEWVNSQKESYRADAATILMADVPAIECDVVPARRI
jgi:hypothetical protein